MEREEWLMRCAARYEACSGLTKEQARDCAEIALDEEISAGTGLNADPEASADEDMSCWTDDGEE